MPGNILRLCFVANYDWRDCSSSFRNRSLSAFEVSLVGLFCTLFRISSSCIHRSFRLASVSPIARRSSTVRTGLISSERMNHSTPLLPRFLAALATSMGNKKKYARATNTIRPINIGAQLICQCQLYLSSIILLSLLLAPAPRTIVNY